MERITLEDLARALKNHIPQEREVPNRIPSAVLVPLVDKGEELHLLFMRKVEDNSRHSGQVSFPGGSYEKGDKDLLATALRETHEELGVPPQVWRILGRLEAVKTRGTPFVIHPFVGHLERESSFRPNPAEVARIFTVPLEHILEIHPFPIRQLDWRGKTYSTFVIPYSGEIIWGATARILDILCRIIKGLPSSGGGPHRETRQ